MKQGSRPGIRLWSVVAVAGCTSCGAGVAAVVAGTSGGGGGGGMPAITFFEVPAPRTSPAPIRLEASEPLVVELSYSSSAGAQQAMSGLEVAGTPLANNRVQLPVTGLTWDFAADLGTDYRSAVSLFAERPGGGAISGGTLHLGMGNDPPEVLEVEPMPGDPAHPAESAGNVEIRLRIGDSSSDPVDVRVLWRRVDDPPDAWIEATAAGVFPDGIGTAPAEEGGVVLSFFWNTNVDLADEEDTVFFRVEVSDGPDVGVRETLQPFRIDNNEEPLVVLDTGPVVSNPDERRGIPIPFRVIDEEADLVGLVFQWRREGEEFPSFDLDGDGTVENVEVDAVLADPLLRREHHVCTEVPRAARGRVVPVAPDTVRLPELAMGESWILASGLVGRTLELLRPSSVPEAVPWTPVAAPVAALPLGDGLTALILEAGGRLREVELATGEIAREITSSLGQGLPTAMALERGEQAVLVALADAGGWRIERVELVGPALGTPVELAASGGSGGPDVRGIASLGRYALVLTSGSSLLHLDYREPSAPVLATLLSGLAGPRGITADPLTPHRVYLSERDADRVLSIELDAHGELPLVVDATDLPTGALQRPGALALERGGARLLIAAALPAGGSQLLGLDLGMGENRAFPIGPPLAADVTSLAGGPDGLRLVCLPGPDGLRAGGGVEQRRVISAHSTLSGETTTEAEFQPAPRPGQPWRVVDLLPDRLRASPQGVDRTFVWNSADATAGPVFLRGMARDDEVGIGAEALARKPVLGALAVDPGHVGGAGVTDGPVSVAVADLDGDGDLDLVSANRFSDDLTVFLQDAGDPGRFEGTPDFTLGTTGSPRSVVAADLDEDGDLDLVSANSAGRNLTVFLQDPPGTFDGTYFVLGGNGVTTGARSVAAADLNGDGRLDLVSANRGLDTLTVFFQLATGGFVAAPDWTLRGITNPVCVVAADLDGDGDLDLASADSGNDDVAVFFQDPAGTFGPSPSLFLGGTGSTSGPASLAAADLDGDGDLDLVSANADGNDLTVFFQDAPGTFASTPLVLESPVAPFAPSGVVAADVDGDGDLDLVSANLNGDNLTAWLQEAPGSFAATPLVIGGDEHTTSPACVAAADLDGDGDLDLVSANRDTGQASPYGSDLTIFLQDSPGSFGTAPLVLGSSPSNRQPLSVAAADLDGDGDLDLAFANHETSQVKPDAGSDLTVYFQLSPGSFASSGLTLGGAGSTDGPCALAAADLDGDGDLDLASANEGGDDLTLFLQDAPGSFALEHRLAVPGLEVPCALVAADLDGDGGMDLVTASAVRDELTVLLQDPSAGFGAPRVLTLGDSTLTRGPAGIVAADLDGDGDLDLVSANEDGDDLTVFLQTAGGFDPLAPSLPTGDGPVSVAAEDLDGDGDLDLVSADKGGDALTVFLQTSGRFDPLALPLPPGSAPVSVATADLDGDGDLDLVSANEGNTEPGRPGGALTVLTQLAPGRFATTRRELLADLAFPTSVQAVDLDGDGDLDLVSGNRVNVPFSRGNLTVFFGGR